MGRVYRGVSPEERSSEYRDRLLRAGTVVLLQKGVHRATIDDFRATAKVSTRVFYSIFGDKEALCTAVVERFSANAVKAINAGIEAAGSESMHLVLGDALEAYISHVARNWSTYTMLSGVAPCIAPDGRRSDAVAIALRSRFAEHNEQCARRMRLTVTTISGAVEAGLADWFHRGDISHEELVAFARELCRAMAEVFAAHHEPHCPGLLAW